MSSILSKLAIALTMGVGCLFGVIWGGNLQAPRLGLIVGTLLGLGLGLVISESARHRSKSSQNELLSLPRWQSLLGSVLVAIAVGVVLNPTVFLFYARQAGLEPWHPPYTQVGQSSGFRLYSDRPMPGDDQIVRFLQDFRTAIGARFFNPGPESCAVDVYLLRQESNYQAVLQTFDIDTPFGFFTPIPRTSRIFVRGQTGLGTLAHEMMHHFLYCSFAGQLPTWVDEGVATLFEKVIAIERDGQLAFSWGYRHNWRDPAIREVMGSIQFPVVLPAGQNQDLFNALFLMLYHQNRVIPLLKQFHDHPDPDGLSTLAAFFNSSLPDIQQQWESWMQKEAFQLPLLERSFIAWAHETDSVDQYFRRNWRWNADKQMWLSPRPEPWTMIPTKERILGY